jgi:hypothetical protein
MLAALPESRMPSCCIFVIADDRKQQSRPFSTAYAPRSKREWPTQITMPTDKNRFENDQES